MDPQPLPRDRFIPWYFVGAFLLLFIIDGVMVTVAIRTQTGVVVDRAYERGLAYNSFLAEQAAQQARGWQGHAAYEAGKLVFVLKDRNGQPLTGARVTAQLVRPVQDGMDFSLTLTEEDAGHYAALARFPQPGLWTVSVEAIWQDQPFRQSQDLVIQR